MSYTTDRQPQGCAFSIPNFLRETMIGELVAINDYNEHIKLTNLPDIKKILHHIMEDEKRHYGMLLDALRKFDSRQKEKSEEVSEKTEISSKPLKTNSEKTDKNSHHLLNAIRGDIKGELEAIIAYEDILEKINDNILKAMIKDIVKDEIEHVEELTKILTTLDIDCYGPLK